MLCCSRGQNSLHCIPIKWPRYSSLQENSYRSVEVVATIYESFLLLEWGLVQCLFIFFFLQWKQKWKSMFFFSFLIDSSIRWFVWGLQSFLQLNTEYRVFPLWLLRWTFFLGWREGHTWELNWKTQTQNLFHTSDCLNWVKLLGEVLQILNLHFGLWNIPFKDGR